jgi:hypothetical protein
MTRVVDDLDHRDVSLAQLLIKHQTNFACTHSFIRDDSRYANKTPRLNAQSMFGLFALSKTMSAFQ